MRPLRRQVSFIWIALFGLALQLVLSFGHIHHHEGGTHHLVVASAAALQISGATSPSDTDDDDEAQCAICWSMTVARAAVLLAPPVALLNLSVEDRQIQLAASAISPSQSLASFQPRAPPAECAAKPRKS